MPKSKRPPVDYDLAGLAGRVIDARKSAGLTQAELAAAVATDAAVRVLAHTEARWWIDARPINADTLIVAEVVAHLDATK